MEVVTGRSTEIEKDAFRHMATSNTFVGFCTAPSNLGFLRAGIHETSLEREPHHMEINEHDYSSSTFIF